MSDTQFIPSLWWLHYKLIGGMSRILMYAVAWLALMGVSLASYRLFPDTGWSFNAHCARIADILGGVQMILLFIFGSNNVYRALLRDTSTNMIESHRISPLNGWGIIPGLVVGPNLHTLILFAMGVGFGVVLLEIAGLGVQNWLVGSVFVLSAASLIWTATVLIGIGRKKPISPISVMMILSVATAFPGITATSLPALGLMTGFYAAAIGAFYLVGSGPPIAPPAALLLLAGTWLVTIIWGRAAARKFRRPDLPAFGLWRALGLFAIWLAVNVGVFVVQFNGKDQLPKDYSGNYKIYGQLISEHTLNLLPAVSLAASVLVGIFPMAAAAHVIARRRLKGRVKLIPDNQWMAAALPVICTVLILSHILIPDDPPTKSKIAITALTILFVWITVRELIVRAFTLSQRFAMQILLFGVVFWVTPFVAASILSEIEWQTNGYDTTEPSQLTQTLYAASPISAITELFDPSAPPRWVGLFFQGALALIIWGRARRAIRRLRASLDTQTSPPPGSSLSDSRT